MYIKRLLIISVITSILTLQLFSQPLDIPVLKNVSVDRTTQQVLLDWTYTTPGSIDGYIIKRKIFGALGVVDGTFNDIEFIYNPLQFSYLDVSNAYGVYSLPGSRVETYRVSAFKDLGGGNIIFSTMSNPVSTIYLSPVEFDLCREQNQLKWTSYNGFGADLKAYNIYYSNTLGGVDVLVAQVGVADTTFVHTHVAANTQYYYYVEAVSNVSGLISNSNYQTVTTTMPPNPQIMNADYATVELHEQVDLAFTVDPNAVIEAYVILKSDSLNGNYDSIASFPSGTGVITYSDFVKTNQEVAYYKVLAINTCGLHGNESNVAHNIVLDAYQDETSQYHNQLHWNAYETWLGGVESYTLYRSIDGGAFEEITQLDATTLNYNDDVTDWVQPEIGGQASKGHFCYYVEARESTANPYGITGISKSNISCVQQETVVFLPNAFNPMSKTEENRTFKPVISFVNDYQLIIYNRWGGIVFQSPDPLQGWDGKGSDGNLLKKGTYVFYLKYRSGNNKMIEKSGQINLVY